MSENKPVCEFPAFQASAEEMAGILKTSKSIAIVGLSPKPKRPSYDVARYFKEHGYTIIPVNPGQKEILGEKCYPSLLDIPRPVDLVDIFREPAAVPEIVDQAIAVKAKAVWMQPGIVHNAAAQKAKAAGLKVVMNACAKTAHMGVS